MLAALTGAALKSLGLNNDISASADYTTSQAWAQAIHGAGSRWDGIRYVMTDGESAEISRVGNDGMPGITFFVGGNSTTIRAVVQSAGMGYRLPASELLAEVGRGRATLRLLLLYTQSLVTQMTQSAACNRHHTLNQQFGRCLLLSFDRLCGDEMVMTQKLISKVLGVSDEVTASPMALSASGAIANRDGRIRLLDRTALERTNCECYQVVKRECDQSCRRLQGRTVDAGGVGVWRCHPGFTFSGLGVDHALVLRVVRDRGGDRPLVGLHGH